MVDGGKLGGLRWDVHMGKVIDGGVECLDGWRDGEREGWKGERENCIKIFLLREGL